MKKKFKFPAFRSNGTAVQLTEVLSVIPANDLVWAVLEFHGTGEAPGSVSMDEFEEKIFETPGGVKFSWAELKDFADGLNQTIDCKIVGAKVDSDALNSIKEKEWDDSSEYEISIEAFDCAEWSVWARDSELMKKFVDLH